MLALYNVSMNTNLPPRRLYTLWHRFLAKILELTVGRLGVQVESEMQISSDPPKIDVVLLRRETAAWTAAQAALLPDGVRDTPAHHVLIEFKYSESLTLDAVIQALGYEYFFRTNRELPQADVQMFILCAQTPRHERLRELGYTETIWPGVLRSSNIYASHITLLLLNELRDEPHNAFVKTFASRKQQKAKAFVLLQQFHELSVDLLRLLEGLETIWSLPEGAKMSELLTVEQVIEIGKERSRLLLHNLPPEEIDPYINPLYKQQLVEEGIEKGIEYRTREIVLAMVARKLDLKTIADVTGLTIDEVKAILAEDHSAH